MRACEIKGLCWQHVDLSSGIIDIRRSKTAAGWRTPTLNEACKRTLARLNVKAQLIGAADPEHYVFPWHGRAKGHSYGWPSSFVFLEICGSAGRTRTYNP